MEKYLFIYLEFGRFYFAVSFFHILLTKFPMSPTVTFIIMQED